MKTKPKTITETLDVSDLKWTTLDNLIQELKDYRDQGWVKWDVEAYEYYGDTSIRIELSKQRLETEEGVAARLKREDYCKEMRRKQYENLKKEFDPKN